MADDPRIRKDLVVVSTLKRLVAKEVHVGVADTAGLLGLLLEVLQAVRLVPALGENVEGDLATNGEPGRVNMRVSLALLIALRDCRLV